MIAIPPTILLVEDDPNDVLLMERAFRKANLDVRLHVVNDGELAIQYLAGKNQFADREQYPIPALMLLDLKLPRRSGLEVLAFVREQKPPLKRLPIIMVTSSKQIIDINHAYELGVNSYVVKPGGFDSLLDMVKTFNHYWFGYNQRPEV